MHRLGDVVEVRLVEAAPVAGALRFELLSEGTKAPRGTRDFGKRKHPGTKHGAASKTGRGSKGKARKLKSKSQIKAKSGKGKRGK
jgi:ribonuclease R